MNSLAGSRVILWAAQQCDVNGLEKSLAGQGCDLQIVQSLDELQQRTVRTAVERDDANFTHVQTATNDVFGVADERGKLTKSDGA